MGGGGSICLDWIDASDAVREWVSIGRSGEGNAVRVLGLRKGTRRKVDVLRGDVGGAVDDGPATGCEDEEAALFGAVNEVTAGDGDGECTYGFSSKPFTEGVEGFPADMMGADAGAA